VRTEACCWSSGRGSRRSTRPGEVWGGGSQSRW
jgi:hypothetical protein